MKCCTTVQHFITQSRSLLVGQSELLHSNVEQLLTNITTVLSKQTTERQERKRCTGVAAKEWRYKLRARTLAAWLLAMASGAIGTVDSILIFFFFFFFEFIYVANLEFYKR